MGYIRTDDVIIHTGHEGHEAIEKWIKKNVLGDIKKLFIFTGPLVNGEYVHFMAWDGSEEGWNESIEADKTRKKFKAELKRIKKRSYLSFAHIQFGGDDNEKVFVDSA